ncbi:N-formylglutamate amidohydrolase [Prescottella agglutinans]|uniref:DUF1833 domain-containing protein n=1 Tax=Prescottella agglutinans TaxID=1644129 RepID=A0ABT6ML21_9NOCA|nr:N-formylglutamate amidohydrolase [Prescottella agglutinans]MDH6284564.1 hypothetical protein [Prescottella agglutinans]
MIDRAALAARIRHDQGRALPSFTAGAPVESLSTLVAESLVTENVTLTVTIAARPFHTEARRWDPAVSGTAVTVTVASTDTTSGARRPIQLAEPEAWVRAIFAQFDDDTQRIYLLGGVDPDTGRPEHGVTAYRLYLDQDAVPLRVPPQLIATPHYWIGPLQ